MVRRDTRAGVPSAPPDPELCPRDGDLVVIPETRVHVHYTVRQFGEGLQFGATVRDDAVRLAVEFGRARAVDVWYREAGVYRLLEGHRPLGSTDGIPGTVRRR